MLRLRLSWLVLLLGGWAAPAWCADDPAAKAVGVLNRYCTSCHGPTEQKGGLRLDSSDAFLAGGDSGEPLAGNPLEDSLLWRRVAVDGDMPPEGPQPTAEEKAILRQWLEGGAPFPEGATAEEVAVVAGQAEQVFRQHCFACHGQQFKAPGLDFGSYESLVFAAREGRSPHVVPGSPGESLLWRRIANESMPPKSVTTRLTREEKEAIRRWVDLGAPRWGAPAKTPRRFVSEVEAYTAIRDYLRGLPESARRRQRFFSFTHLHNNATISDESLALFKAALSKLINSLSWEAEIVVPRPVDPQETVYVIDLRDLDWTEERHWSRLFDARKRDDDEQHSGYPYGLAMIRPAALEDLAREIQFLAQSTMSKLWVRADWFVVKASRPPLYHELLELPATADELEKRLEVNTQQDWLRGRRLMRGAVTQSKVSLSNRVLDRHPSLHGAYWLSYDFSTSTGAGRLPSRPLGPSFDNHPFAELAFRHDGGEIVFTLPNGLNGYLIVDRQKKRIATAPVEIVRDANEWSGTPQVVTGVSCIACHRNGFVRFTDDVRSSALALLSGPERRKVEDLFVPPGTMDQRLDQDEERFLAALLTAVRPFLPVRTIDELRDLPEEPVGALAQFYNADLTLATAAAELGYESPQELRAAIEHNPQAAPLAPLKNGGVIKREQWEHGAGAAPGTNSGFQNAAAALSRGVPAS